MISLFSTRQIRDVDFFAINELGIPGEILMENASLEIFRIAGEKFESLKKPVSTLGFICGKGNNGGDGYAAARHFANDGYNIVVLQLGEESEMSPDCRLNFNILLNLSEYNSSIRMIEYKSAQSINELKKCDVIFDAMLGSGSKGELKEPFNKLVTGINKINALKIAIDIPTGLDADKGTGTLVFKADLTITLADYKQGLFFGDGYAYSGEVIKGGIGIDQEYFNHLDTNFYLIEPDDAYNNLPDKTKNVHKYTAGKVLTIAGSGEFPGAAVMTSKSAFKVGAGASILAFPKQSRNLISKNLSEVVLHSYSKGASEYLTLKDIEEINNRIRWADAVAVGPGLGRNKGTQSAVLEIIRKRKTTTLILDADALYPLNNKNYRGLNLTDVILTPHQGEFSSMLGISTDELKKDPVKYGSEFVKDTKSFLVLKGAPTIIFSPSGDIFINSSGNQGMAKFGTGDVLTGVLAGILSQQKDKLKGIIAGVYIHSLTGDLLSRNYTYYGYTATDIIAHIPFTIKFLRDSFA